MTRGSLTRWLVGHAKGLVSFLVIAILARIANQLLGILIFIVAAEALLEPWDSVIASLRNQLIILALLKGVLRYLEHWVGHMVAFTALQRLRELFFARLIPQAPAATQGKAGAELTERATRDIDRIEVFFAHTMPPAVSAIVVPAVTIGWLWDSVSTSLAAILIPFVIVVVGLVPLVSARSTWRAAGRIAEQRGRLATHLADDIQGADHVVQFEAETRRLAGLASLDERLGHLRSHSGAILGLRMGIGDLVMLGALAAMAAATVQGLADYGQLVAASATLVGLWGPVRGMDGFATGLDNAFAATRRVRDVVEAPVLITDPSSPVKLPDGPLDVELHDVTFRYPNAARDAVSEVNASFRRWSFVVGVSGAGKSTLGGLILRSWKPESGTICLGGVPVERLRLDELRRAVALVDQRPVMISGSVADNVRLGAPNASDEDLWWALKIVDLDAWVRSLPHGLGTGIAERGLSVSGGQLQRLALARALVTRPRVLILDEALSQIDAGTATTIRARLAEVECSIIEITHRVDLVPDDAPVTIMDAGRVVDRGLGGELRASSESFARLMARL